MAGEIQLNSVSLATESSSAITLGSAVSLNSAAYASTSEVQGTHTTGTVTSGTTSLTVGDGSGISNGDYVVGEGITPGTTVSSGGGTTSITLSANAGATLSSDKVSFYKADKVLSPGLVAGGLCRAWCQVDNTGAIQASYNVSSVSVSGNIFTFNFTTAMPDENFAVIHWAMGEGTSNANGVDTGGRVPNPTKSTTFTKVQYRNTSTDNTVAPTYACMAVFR